MILFQVKTIYRFSVMVFFPLSVRLTKGRVLAIFIDRLCEVVPMVKEFPVLCNGMGIDRDFTCSEGMGVLRFAGKLKGGGPKEAKDSKDPLQKNDPWAGGSKETGKAKAKAAPKHKIKNKKQVFSQMLGVPWDKFELVTQFGIRDGNIVNVLSLAELSAVAKGVALVGHADMGVVATLRSDKPLGVVLGGPLSKVSSTFPPHVPAQEMCVIVKPPNGAETLRLATLLQLGPAEEPIVMVTPKPEVAVPKASSMDLLLSLRCHGSRGVKELYSRVSHTQAAWAAVITETLAVTGELFAPRNTLVDSVATSTILGRFPFPDAKNVLHESASKGILSKPLAHAPPGAPSEEAVPLWPGGAATLDEALRRWQRLPGYCGIILAKSTFGVRVRAAELAEARNSLWPGKFSQATAALRGAKKFTVLGPSQCATGQQVAASLETWGWPVLPIRRIQGNPMPVWVVAADAEPPAARVYVEEGGREAAWLIRSAEGAEPPGVNSGH